jgi:peroxiredoxin
MLGKLLIALLFFAGGPQFRLRDTQGATHTPSEWAAQKAVVLFFVTIDCPIGNSYVPEMNRIRDAYAPRGVAVYAVQADPGVRDADVAKYAREYRYTFPLLLDPEQVLVQHTGATVTPQAAVLSPDGKLLYLGPIDDRVVDFGKSRPKATESYVRMMLDATLNGRGITFSPQRSLGCSIPRKSK